MDPGELIKELFDVRGRLDKIRKGHEGRGRLIGVVLGNDVREPSLAREDDGQGGSQEAQKGVEASKIRNLIELDKRVGGLEKLVGSSSAALDEVNLFSEHSKFSGSTLPYRLPRFPYHYCPW